MGGLVSGVGDPDRGTPFQVAGPGIFDPGIHSRRSGLGYPIPGVLSGDPYRETRPGTWRFPGWVPNRRFPQEKALKPFAPRAYYQPDPAWFAWVPMLYLGHI